MSSTSLDEIRRDAVLASVSGCPFLLTFSLAWLAAGGLSYAFAPEIAAWVYVFAGAPAVPVAIALERRMGYIPPPKPDPLLPLALQLMFVQVVAFPAIIIVWDQSPPYVPVAFAAIVGAHFVPFQWVYRTRLYGVLAVVVAVGPFALLLLLQDAAIHATGFFVGVTLLVGAFFARAHARATWRVYRETQA